MPGAVNIGSAEIELLLNSDKFKAAVRGAVTESDKLEEKTKKTAEGMRTLGTALTAIGATISLGVGFAVKYASDLEETTSKFNVVFSGQESKAQGFLKTLTDNFAMSRLEGSKFLAEMQDLLVPMGMASDKAADMSFEIVKLSADLGSFNNLPTAQVMGDIQSALVGNYETMKKYGVVINATTVEQKAMEMGLARTKGELTASHKAQAAYAMMLSASQAATGDMSRTSEGYANTLKDLQAKTGDIVAILGNNLLPIATAVIGTFRDGIKWVTEFATEHETLGKYLVLGVSAFGALAAAIGPVLLLLPTLTTGIKAIGIAMQGVWGPLGWIALGITAVIALYEAWSNNFLGIRDITGNVFDAVMATMDFYGAWIGNFINKIANSVDTLFTYTLKAQIAFRKLMGENADELEDQLKTLHERMNEREAETAARQGKSWNDYYNERQNLRKLLTQAEEIQIEKVKQLDINAANERAAANIKATAAVREYKIKDMGLEESQRKYLEDALIESLDKEQQLSFDATVQKAEWRAKDMEEELKAMNEKVELEEEASKHVAGRWEESFNRVSNAMAEHIVDSVTKMKGFGDLITTIFDDMKTTIIGTFRQILVDYVQNFLKSMLSETQGGFGGIFGGLLDSLKSGLGSLVKGISGGAGGILGSVGGAISGAVGAIPGWGQAALGVGAAVTGIVAGVKALFGSKTYKASQQQEDAAHQIIGTMLGLDKMGVDLSANAEKNVQAMWKQPGKEWVYDAFWNVWQGFVDQAYKEGNLDKAVQVTGGRLQELGYYGKGAGGSMAFQHGGIVPAMLHAGEMVLPPNLSEFIQNAAAQYSTFNNMGGLTINVSGVGNDVMNDPDRLADVITEKIASRVYGRVRVGAS